MTGKRTFFIALLLMTLSAFHAAAECVPIASSDAWAPPDLSGLTAASSPSLLVLKIAQEEIGYMEGPRSDETKYGAWFGDARYA